MLVKLLSESKTTSKNRFFCKLYLVKKKKKKRDMDKMDIYYHQSLAYDERFD